MAAHDELVRGASDPPPWTLEGEIDPRYDDDVRDRHHALLTDPLLRHRFLRRYPLWRRAEYDEMIRALGYVWDCRYDGTVSVTGYCCPVCDRGRADAGE